MNISPSITLALRERGYDVVSLGEQGLYRLPDRNILDKARDEGRIVLTFDLDFGVLLAAGAHSLPSVILFRLRNMTPVSVIPGLLEVVSACRSNLESGAIVVVEDAGYRLRALPIQTG